jgi:TolB protein
LWKLDLSTNQQYPLTLPPPDSEDLLSAWSFDGRSVAFTRRQAGTGGLWLVPANGGDPRPLLKDRFDNSNPAWSRDNRRIVFESNRGGTDNLWEVDVTSGRVRQMTTGGGADVNPAVGPQNGLMYVRLIQEVTLFQLDIETGREDPLTSNTGKNYWPRFSPDGRRMVYQSNQTGNWEVWILDVKTKEETPLTNHPSADIAPEWSPDGQYVSFLSNRSGPFQIWLLDIRSGKVSRLLTKSVLAPRSINYGHGGQIPAHRWSPDGHKIGFLTRDEQKTALWSVDRYGKNPQELISGLLDFDWYRDCRHIVYTRTATDTSGLRELVLLDLVSGDQEVILRGPYVDVAAAKTGNAVLFASGASHFSQDLFMLPLSRFAQALVHTSGEPTQLTHGNGLWHVHNGTWSPDGKSVAFSRDRAEADIYLIENYR